MKTVQCPWRIEFEITNTTTDGFNNNVNFAILYFQKKRPTCKILAQAWILCGWIWWEIFVSMRLWHGIPSWVTEPNYRLGASLVIAVPVADIILIPDSKSMYSAPMGDFWGALVFISEKQKRAALSQWTIETNLPHMARPSNGARIWRRDRKPAKKHNCRHQAFQKGPSMNCMCTPLLRVLRASRKDTST